MLSHAIIGNALCPFPVLANNVFPHILHAVRYHLVDTDEVCVAINLSPKHIHSPLSKAMTTSSDLQSSFIQMGFPFGFVTCSTPVCFPTFTIVSKVLVGKIQNILFEQQNSIHAFIHTNHFLRQTYLNICMLIN